MIRIDLSAASHSNIGRLLEHFMHYLRILTPPIREHQSSYHARIADGGQSRLILYKDFINDDEFKVCVDLMCEDLINKQVAEAFKTYIMTSFKENKKNEKLLEALNNIKL